MFRVKFWGVRGSIPSPITGVEIEEKIIQSIYRFLPKFLIEESLGESPEEIRKTIQLSPSIPFWMRQTYGGNTTCVEVRCGKQIFVLDMGTGIRPFGNSLFKEMFELGGLKIVFLLSHVHWDHIQGLPFFGPLYISKYKAKNSFEFYGGLDWQRTLDVCLKGQMDPPVFPVSFKEIQALTHQLDFQSVHDRMSFETNDGEGGKIKVTCRKLNHPQETYGWRIEYRGKVFAFTTDNEPYDPAEPDPRLVEVAKNADVWATDCQYTKDIYNGKEGGVPRHGWGHSYPEAVIETALRANVRAGAKVILTHHDPASSDKKIYEITEYAQKLVPETIEFIRPQKYNPDFTVEAAYEGLTIDLE